MFEMLNLTLFTALFYKSYFNCQYTLYVNGTALSGTSDSGSVSTYNLTDSSTTDTSNPDSSSTDTSTDSNTQEVTGDVTGDKVTMEDVVMLQKYIAELVDLTDLQKALGDVTGDSDIDMLDVIKILSTVQS